MFEYEFENGKSREETLEKISIAIEEISNAEKVIQSSKGRILDAISVINRSCKKDAEILGKKEIGKKLRLALIGSDGDEILSVYDEVEILSLLNISALCKSLKVARSSLMDKVSRMGFEAGVRTVIKDGEIKIATKKKPKILQLYVQTLRRGDAEYLKVGISEDTASRVFIQDKKSDFYHQVDHIFVGEYREVRDVEMSIKRFFKRADIKRSWMPDGYTEVFEVKDRAEILSLIHAGALKEVDKAYPHRPLP